MNRIPMMVEPQGLKMFDGLAPVFCVLQVGMKEVVLPPPSLRGRLQAWWRGEACPRVRWEPDIRLGINSDVLAARWDAAP